MALRTAAHVYIPKSVERTVRMYIYTFGGNVTTVGLKDLRLFIPDNIIVVRTFNGE